MIEIIGHIWLCGDYFYGNATYSKLLNQLEISDTCYFMTRVALKLDPTRSEAIMTLPPCAVTSSQGFHEPPD